MLPFNCPIYDKKNFNKASFISVKTIVETVIINIFETFVSFTAQKLCLIYYGRKQNYLTSVI